MGTRLFASMGFDVPTVWRHEVKGENLLAPSLPLGVDTIASDVLCARYGKNNTQAASELFLRLMAVVPGFDQIDTALDLSEAALRSMLVCNTVSLVKPERGFTNVPVFARLEDAVVWFSDQIDIGDPTRMITGLIHFIRRVGQTPNPQQLRHYLFDPALRDKGYVYQTLQIFLGASQRNHDENILLSRMLCASYFDPRVQQDFPETFYCSMHNVDVSDNRYRSL